VLVEIGREKEFNAWLKQMENEEKNSTVRASLEKRLAALENKVKAGSARLLSIPEDLLADATSALQEIKAERNAVSQELSRLGGDKMTNRQNDKTVSGYLDAVQQLARKLVKGDSAKVNAALREVGNPMPFPQPVVPPKCFQATFSTDTST